MLQEEGLTLEKALTDTKVFQAAQVEWKMVSENDDKVTDSVNLKKIYETFTQLKLQKTCIARKQNKRFHKDISNE